MYYLGGKLDWILSSVSPNTFKTISSNAQINIVSGRYRGLVLIYNFLGMKIHESTMHICDNAKKPIKKDKDIFIGALKFWGQIILCASIMLVIFIFMRR